jgi:hypothetical protein
LLKHLLTALSRVGTGLLYGIGIGITGGAMMYFVTERMASSMWNDAALKNVRITKHEKVERHDQTLVLGTVTNDSEEAVRLLNVEVDLFDASGKFVEQCSESLRGSLAGGEERNFKVTCSGCKDKPVVQHSTYKVRLNGV